MSLTSLWRRWLGGELHSSRSRRRPQWFRPGLRSRLRLQWLEDRRLLSVAPVGPEFPVNTYTIIEQADPSAATNGDGALVIAWHSMAQGEGVFAQRYNAAGAPQGTEFRVNNTTTGDQELPSAAMDADGDFVIAWSGAGVFARQYTASGVPLGNEFPVATPATARAPKVAMAADGDFVIVWQDFGQNLVHRGVFAQRFDAAGAPQGSEFRVNQNDSPGQDSPSVAINANGSFVIAWESSTHDGFGNGIVARRYNAAGEADGDEFLVNTFTQSQETRPSVAADADGDFVIAWESNAQEGSGGIYAQRYSAAGAPLGGELHVNTFTPGNQTLPRVAMTPDGDFVVAWQSNGQDGSSWGVYAQDYTSDGLPQDGEFRVNTFLPGVQEHASLAIDPNHGMVIAWQSDGQDGSGDGIYAQRFALGDNSGAALIDDGDGGFFTSGSWLTGSGVGRGNDVLAAAQQPGAFDAAHWSFDVSSPGRYRVSATWYVNPDFTYLFADAAPFSIFDGGVARGTAVVNQRQVPDDFSDAGSEWEDLGVFDVTGGSLNVQLSSTAAGGYVVADAVRIERIGDLSATPEIHVTDNGYNLLNAGSVALGTVELNHPLVRNFTVANVGAAALTITVPIAVPSGYTLLVPPPLTTLASGQSTTFAVRLDANLPGDYSGQVSFATNDAEENPFTFAVSGSVLATQILDDTPTNSGRPFSATANWGASGVGLGRGGDYRYALNPPSPTIGPAIWTFNVTPGQYRVYATWPENSSYWATAAIFTVRDGQSPVVGSAVINQRLAPVGISDAGSVWQDFGSVFNITDVTLTVHAHGTNAGGYVIADGIRIERVGDLPSAAAVQVTDGTFNVPHDGQPYDFGTVSSNATRFRRFFLSNGGLTTLTLTLPISVPPGYTVTRNPDFTTLGPGGATVFDVDFQALAPGTYNGQISIANSSGVNPFLMNVTATVLPTLFLDDATANSSTFSRTGNWGDAEGIGGRDNDYRFALDDGTGNQTATWTRTVAPGVYRVAGTWPENTTYWATNAPFTILDGATPRGNVLVDQRTALGLLPGDFTDTGSNWRPIGGLFNIAGTTLSVRVAADSANGYVMADAIRLEFVGDLPISAEVEVSQGLTFIPNFGAFSYGTVELNHPVEKTFTISNVGQPTLTIDPMSLSIPPGYTLVSPPALATLSAGQTTTFTVRLDANLSGTYAGQISMPTNDADENPLSFNITGIVLATQILDDGQPGFVSTGDFQSASVSIARDGDASYVYFQAAPSEATWTFTVAPGEYRIAATWFDTAGIQAFSGSSPFTILDGGTPVSTALINQRFGPNDFVDARSSWAYLGVAVNIFGTTLTVRLTNIGADGYVLADAIRIERLGPTNGNAEPADDGDSGSASSVLEFPPPGSGRPEQPTSDPLGSALAMDYWNDELDEVTTVLAEDQATDALNEPSIERNTTSERDQSEALDVELSNYL